MSQNTGLGRNGAQANAGSGSFFLPVDSFISGIYCVHMHTYLCIYMYVCVYMYVCIYVCMYGSI